MFIINISNYQKDISAEDLTYAIQILSAVTGMSPGDVCRYLEHLRVNLPLPMSSIVLLARQAAVRGRRIDLC